MGYSDETWYVVRSALKYYPCVLLLLMHILITSFAYLFWLANNNKVKYSEFSMGYSDETFNVGSNTLKYYPCVPLLLMLILSTSFAYSPKSGPRCIFSEYSERVSREPQNSRLVFFLPPDGGNFFFHPHGEGEFFPWKPPSWKSTCAFLRAVLMTIILGIHFLP